VFVICLALGVFTACESTTTVAGPTALSSGGGTATGASTPFGVEPATLRPELISGGNSCGSFRPFNANIVLVVSGGSAGFVHGVRFRFTDRFGIVTLPGVSSSPSGFPVPFPNGIAPLPTPIPIPGSTTNPSQRLPFFLRFDCGVRPDGMLGISVDSADTRGRMQTSQLQVQVTP